MAGRTKAERIDKAIALLEENGYEVAQVLEPANPDAFDLDSIRILIYDGFPHEAIEEATAYVERKATKC